MTTMNADEPSDTLHYDPATETFSVNHDWERDEPISTVVVKMVSSLEDVPPTALDPLHDYVDPDALDRLVAPKRDGQQRTGAYAAFRFEGYDVTVSGDGQISLYELD